MSRNGTIGMAALAAGALVLAWLALGRSNGTDPGDHKRTVQQIEELQANTADWRTATPVPVPTVPGKPDQPIALEDDPRIRRVTSYCKQLIGHQRRNVPSDVLLDMIRDGAMRFDDDDLQCMSVGGAKPAILDMAARQPK